MELTNFKFTDELNKAKEELEKTRDEVRLTKAELEATKDEWKRAEDRADLCEHMVSAAIDDIKASVEAQIDQACKEVKSDTCSGFLYTLWLNHPEMDFSFFGDEAIRR